MEIAVMTCFFAERDMKVDAGHRAKVRASLQWLLFLLLLSSRVMAQGPYALRFFSVDGDSAVLHGLLPNRGFRDKEDCLRFVEKLPATLAKKGFVTASIDSFSVEDAFANLYLFLGRQYFWGRVSINGLTEIERKQSGIAFPQNPGRPFQSVSVETMELQIVRYLADHGFPFASVQLDSITMEGDRLNGVLMVNKGMPYRMDSIRIIGSAKLSEKFLRRYLELPLAGTYRLSSFEAISSRLRELPYVQEKQPWVMRFGGNGALLDLYLEPRKSSQVNLLLGLLPSNDPLRSNKVQVTGEANLLLKNALGGGETLSLNWQQLQVKSPRLDFAFQQPFLFGSPFGITTRFDLFKKDSSYLTINGMMGAQYSLSARQTGNVFLLFTSSNLTDVDTQRIKQSRQLPPDMDMRTVQLGVDYELNTTNYRRNPRSGWDFSAGLTAGTRRIRPNHAILDIKDPDFNAASLYDTVDLHSYQFHLKSGVAVYLPSGRQATFKLQLTGAWVQSPRLYRNELFQIGGYKLMRGFDEESIFSSAYLINTVEYRYLTGQNSFFFVFTDLGITNNRSHYGMGSNRLLGVGLGLAFETAAGYFNLSLAAGKRNDTSFDLRQTKIHLGYVNYF